MRAKVGTTDDGGVTFNFPKDDGDFVGMTMTPDPAEAMAHALLVQAYVARGHRPGEKQFRLVRGWVLR
jgi:hypothetical protein